MDEMNLTEQEIRIIKDQLKLPRYYLFMLVIVLVAGLCTFWGSTYYYQPALESIFVDMVEPDTGLKQMVLDAMHVTNGLYVKTFIFFFFLLGVLIIGQLYTQKKVNKILKKFLSKE